MCTREGLPFVCTMYMKLIMEGIMARVQRDLKVILCHYLWMANHPHIIIVAKDAAQASAFHGEIKKQLTEAIKRLLGLSHLCLWAKNGTSIIPYEDLNTIKDRIAYLYANPARADLVETIADYPGLSSWEQFQNAESTLKANKAKLCPWIRTPMIEALPKLRLTRHEDHALAKALLSKAKSSHVLSVHPNAWMSVFGIVDLRDIEATNGGILRILAEYEEQARRKRRLEGRGVKGADRLLTEPISMSYVSKKEKRRIHVYSIDPERRKQLLREHQGYSTQCREAYRQWQLGNYSVEWPPGAFRPPMPINANWLQP